MRHAASLRVTRQTADIVPFNSSRYGKEARLLALTFETLIHREVQARNHLTTAQDL